METTYTNNTGMLAGIFGVGMLFVWLVVYLFIGYCLKTIADKTGHTENSFWAWIPIMNILLLLQIAGKPAWWIVLMIIPFVNFIVAIIVMMEVAKARGKESWWGIIAAVVPIIGWPYLAFSDTPATANAS
jgi:hypothetical protein